MQRKNVAIARVRLDESENECTMCGVCEAACPEIFEVPEKVIIKEGADFGLVEEAIEEAAESCPANCIAIEYNHSG